MLKRTGERKEEKNQPSEVSKSILTKSQRFFAPSSSPSFLLHFVFHVTLYSLSLSFCDAMCTDQMLLARVKVTVRCRQQIHEHIFKPRACASCVRLLMSESESSFTSATLMKQVLSVQLA